MIVLKFLAGFFLFYLLLVILLYFKQNSLVYFAPSMAQIDIGPLEKFTHQEVVTSDGLKIKGYYIAPKGKAPVIVEFHGNASHPAWESSKFSDLVAQGYGIFLAEYRGYGGNPGTPNEQNLYLDGEAYLKWISENPDLKDNKIIVYGASIGSGVAVDVAKNHPEISALILEVPFDKLSNVGAFHYPYIPFAEHLMTNKFPNIDKIKDIKVPTLYLLAGKDEVAPIQFGQALYDAGNQPKFLHVFGDASHIDVYNHGAARVVRYFLAENFQ